MIIKPLMSPDAWPEGGKLIPIPVRVTKLSRLPNRPEGTLEAIEGVSAISEGYTLSGTCDRMPQVGRPFHVERHERNGVKIYGLFNTSVVQSIQPNDDGTLVIRTENSTYLVETLS